MLVATLLFSTAAYARQATVSYTISGCDYFVINTGSGFGVLEWYGGYEVNKGDTVVGELDAYGMHTIFDTSFDREMRVWVEEYSVTKKKL